jgi:hypothetical protein
MCAPKHSKMSCKNTTSFTIESFFRQPPKTPNSALRSFDKMLIYTRERNDLPCLRGLFDTMQRKVSLRTSRVRSTQPSLPRVKNPHAYIGKPFRSRILLQNLTVLPGNGLSPAFLNCAGETPAFPCQGFAIILATAIK